VSPFEIQRSIQGCVVWNIPGTTPWLYIEPSTMPLQPVYSSCWSCYLKCVLWSCHLFTSTLLYTFY